ncbi:MAG: VTT domain-containing protein [Candidatus Diapherotrites archaeon]|uniref:VTT domain-containing protein n=1 Tax=Candidatus Iainarchaeum sp. TaxID=3101447 RepID=A0A938YUE3_9ARCH|nr:VTT domain-containing protein [Candidatus Diapherotrites archaeon]
MLDVFFGSTTAIASFIYTSPFGILVLFFFVLFANATIFFPVLVEPIVFAVAGFAPDPYTALFIGSISGVASAIGEMSGYILGLLGVKTLQKMKPKRVNQIFEIGESLADKGIPIIFLGALTPFPFDLLGIAAGIIRYDPKRFFLAALGGKLARYVLIAMVGFYGVSWLKPLFGL